MARFTSDNTEGYTAAQLAELNRRFEAAIAEVPEDRRDKSVSDHVAEQVLDAFDTEHADEIEAA